MIAKLNANGEVVKVVFVDWSSEQNHVDSDSPVRDNSDFPVLQSYRNGGKNDFGKVWGSKSDHVFVVSPDQKITASFDLTSEYNGLLFNCENSTQMKYIGSFLSKPKAVDKPSSTK